MSKRNEFEPDWVSPPGDTIADILEENAYSHAEFADRMGQTQKWVHDLLRSKVPISRETAGKLELVLGSKSEFWIARDVQYRKLLSQLDAPDPLDSDWLKELPVEDMIRFGWIGKDAYEADSVGACLRFFGVASVAAWHATYRDVLDSAVFRTSPKFELEPPSVAAWLRQGEMRASELLCDSWDANGFQSALSDLRRFTRKRDPNVFLPELRRQCAACGVAVVIVRTPKGCHASGATRFLSPSRALLMLSFRYLSDDQFWFTFFHEAGHLLLHGKKSLFIEGMKKADPRESEANDFSANVLIPAEYRSELERLPVGRHEIRNFARKVGVSAGIVLGQLQHLRRARPNQLSVLKVRYTWANHGIA